MREIGLRLQQERINQGHSLDDISKMTRFSVSQLQALEGGDLDFFKDDLTYVKFFVQNYCKILKVDYNQFKEVLDDSMLTYTSMLTQKEMESLRKTNAEIQKKVQLQGGGKNSKSKKKVDFSLLSLLVLASVMILGLFVIFGKYIVPNWFGAPSNTTLPPIVTSPPIVSQTTGSSTTPIVSAPVRVEQVDESHYVVENYGAADVVTVSIAFHNRTWIDVSLDGERIIDPASNKVYQPGDVITYEIPCKAGSELKLNLGYYDSNVFTVNGTEWRLASSIANKAGGHVIYLTLKGD